MLSKDCLSFTGTFSELLFANLSVKNALSFMLRMDNLNKNVKKGVAEILNFLEEGSLFSLALKKCLHINFSRTYIAFVSSAEESGKLCETFTFLYDSLKKKKERTEKIIAALLYPSFVLLLALFLSAFFIFYAKEFSSTFTVATAMSVCFQANALLLFYILGIFILVKRLCQEKELVFLFKIVSFLTASNLGVYKSFKIALLATKRASPLYKKVAMALSMLEEGFSVFESCRVFGKEIALYLELAEFSGNEAQAFLSAADFLQKNQEKKEKVLMTFLEPVTIVLLALYIGILLKSLVMPILFNF